MINVYDLLRYNLQKSRWWIIAVWAAMLVAPIALAIDGTGVSRSWLVLSWLPLALVWLAWLPAHGFPKGARPVDDDASPNWWHSPLAKLLTITLVIYLPAIVIGISLRSAGGENANAILRWLKSDPPVWLALTWIAYNFNLIRTRSSFIAPALFWILYEQMDATRHFNAQWPTANGSRLLWLFSTALCAGLVYWKPKWFSFAFGTLVCFGWCGSIMAPEYYPINRLEIASIGGGDSVAVTLDSLTIERDHLMRIAFHIDALVDGDVARVGRWSSVSVHGVRNDGIAEIVAPGQRSQLRSPVWVDSTRWRVFDATGRYSRTYHLDPRTPSSTDLVLSPVSLRPSGVGKLKRGAAVAVVAFMDSVPPSWDALRASFVLDISSVRETRRVPMRPERNSNRGDSAARLVHSKLDARDLWALRRSYFTRSIDRSRAPREPELRGSLRAQLRQSDGTTHLLALSEAHSSRALVVPGVVHRIEESQILAPYDPDAQIRDTLILESLSTVRRFEVNAKVRLASTTGGGR